MSNLTGSLSKEPIGSDLTTKRLKKKPDEAATFGAAVRREVGEDGGRLEVDEAAGGGGEAEDGPPHVHGQEGHVLFGLRDFSPFQIFYFN